MDDFQGCLSSPNLSFVTTNFCHSLFSQLLLGVEKNRFYTLRGEVEDVTEKHRTLLSIEVYGDL